MRTAAAAVFALLAVPMSAGVKVVDSAGRPVPGATVTILLESGNQAAQVFGDEPLVHRTDDQGLLPFDLPRAGGALVVVDHERYAPAMLALDGAQPPPAIRLQEGLTLSGGVGGDGHMPLGPGKVCAIRTVSTRKSGETFEVRRCALVAADGTWTLSALPEGTQRLEIGVPAYLPLSEAITLPALPWSRNLDAGLRAFVQVEDAAGRPAAGATVECDGAVPVVTDPRGGAWTAVSSSGSKCRAFAVDGAESSPVEIEVPSAARQTLRLKRARSATAKLITDDGSEPAPPRFILLGRIRDVGQSSTRVEPVSQKNGAFRIRLPDDEPHAVRVETPGMLPLTTDWFTLPPGGGTADLGVLLLRRGAGVRGQVVHASTQAPLAGAVVSLEAQGRARIILGRLGKTSTLTDSDGSFIVGGVPIGSYRMRVTWRDLPASETVIDLREENVLTAGTVALHPGVRVAGHVARGDREPLSAARVDFIPSRFYDTEAVASAHTTAEGTFGPVTIAPGTYRLLVRTDDVLADQEIVVPTGEDSFEVDVRIQSTRLTALVREAGVPVPGGEVLLQRSADLRGSLGVAVARNPRVGTQFWSGRSSSPLTATVNDAGVFSIDGVPAGRLVLQYFGREGESIIRTLDVPDEPEATLSIDIDGWNVLGRVDDAVTETGLAARVEMVDANGTSVFQGSTQPTGEFSVDRLAPGIYDVVVSAEGYQTNDPVRVVVGDGAPPPVHVRLTRAADATLDVIVKRDGAIPAAGVAVSIVDAVGRQLRAFPTLADGKLHTTGLSAGTVYLIWSDPLAGVGMSAPIHLRSGPQEANVHLEPGKDLVVRCEASDCSGARLGSLAFTSEHGIDLAPFFQRMGAVVYSDRGSAYLGRLAPGRYDVAASAGAFQLSQDLELGSGPGEVALFLTRR